MALHPVPLGLPPGDDGLSKKNEEVDREDEELDKQVEKIVEDNEVVPPAASGPVAEPSGEVPQGRVQPCVGQPVQ